MHTVFRPSSSRGIYALSMANHRPDPRDTGAFPLTAGGHQGVTRNIIRVFRPLTYEEFGWIVQQPTYDVVITNSCYILRDILSCISLFGIIHLLAQRNILPIRRRWKILLPAIGFFALLLCLYLVVCHAEHIRMYMEFIPMEFISLILLGMLLAGRYQRHHNESAQDTK